MSIRQLPEDVVSKIRSSATIASLNGVVSGLLKNSLDAGATRVNIYVDYVRGNCTVEDDGQGIGPDELAEQGGLGRSYNTSKFPPSSGIHGRHGNFLASLAILSLLTLTSHHNRHNSHNSVSILHGKVLKRQSGDRFDSFDHGTRVAVHDLFGSLPVRVKHRATVFADRSNVEREWGRLIHDVVGLLLSWPGAVSVYLRETRTKRELRLKSPENADIPQRVLRLFTQASLADSSDAESWIPVSASSGHIKVKGCISRSPVATRKSQLMSIGIAPITNEYGTNILYEEVNKVFKNSGFGIIEGAESAQVASDGKTNTGPKARKGIDRWPMFYFRIMLRGVDYVFDMDDVSTQSRRDLDGIVSLLRAMSYGFLKKYHMRPHAIQIASEESAFSTAPTRSISRQSKGRQSSSNGGTSQRSHHASPIDPALTRLDSPFDSWSRLKVGYRTGARSVEGKKKIGQDAAEQQTTEARQLIGEDGKLLRKPFDNVTLTNRPLCEERGKMETNRAIARLAERPKRTAESLSSERAKIIKQSPIEDDTKDELGDSQRVEEPSEWLQDVLESWETPIFESTQRPFRRVNDEAPASRQEARTRFDHECDTDEGQVNFEAGSVGLHGRVSRSSLLEAEVISQVDRKFIILKLPLQRVTNNQEPSGPSALVMLDQHAADERCRLEDLMVGYFDEVITNGSLRPVVEVLARPLVFEVPKREATLLERHQKHFAAWGIFYNLELQVKVGAGKPNLDGGKAMVTALPPSILERCRSEPRLLVELMRKEIWKLNDDEGIVSRPHRMAKSSNQHHATTANFHGCPRGILELLHSRACRSAIMFNDPLTKDACQQLVRRLAHCAFPFQCAHGRPSMVPLVDLGVGSRMGQWYEGKATKVGTVESWKSWMSS